LDINSPINYLRKEKNKIVKGSLLWKLLAVNILTIGFVILIVWLAIDNLAAGYFTVLMEKYNISPTESHQMFVDSVHRYLIWASLGGLVFAIILSFVLIGRVLGPLRQMTHLTHKMSTGDYSDQIPFKSRDEVGRLASAFNQMAESLSRIETLRKTMVIDVAHELRTPLTNIKGYLEALTDGVSPPVKETFMLLQEETMRLVHLVEDLLHLAKADAARGNLNKVSINLEDLILQGIKSFKSQFDGKNINLEKSFDKNTPSIQADPEKLAQVMNNLFQNACRYTPEGGKLGISIEQMVQEVRVVFANTGGELEEQDLPYIFERFYRGEKSRSREHGGAGIGLAIVKELIEAHGGRVGANISQGETHIWFTLPI